MRCRNEALALETGFSTSPSQVYNQVVMDNTSANVNAWALIEEYCGGAETNYSSTGVEESSTSDERRLVAVSHPSLVVIK